MLHYTLGVSFGNCKNIRQSVDKDLFVWDNN